MQVRLEDYTYRSKWYNYKTDSYSGYEVRMTEYHRHSYYEISLIYSGNVKVLLDGFGETSEEPRIVLLRPGAAHYIASDPSTLYCRKNILFSPELIPDTMPQWKNMLKVFSENGNVVKLSDEIRDKMLMVFDLMDGERELGRFCCLLGYLLSLVGGLLNEQPQVSAIPQYVTQALSYIGTNFTEQLTAETLAWKFGVGRTTLMTRFKQHTGMTLKEYITRCRLKSAVACLESGMTVQQAAMESGFSDAGNLIYASHRYFHTTPQRYVSGLQVGKNQSV